jgi:hypothetical protein
MSVSSWISFSRYSYVSPPQPPNFIQPCFKHQHWYNDKEVIIYLNTQQKRGVTLSFIMSKMMGANKFHFISEVCIYEQGVSKRHASLVITSALKITWFSTRRSSNWNWIMI